MKRILTFLFLFSFLFASSQTQFLGAPNTTIVVKGNMKVDSILYLPKREKTPTDTGALRYQISDSSLYVWTGSAWRKAKNDGTVTSVGLTMPTAFAVANSPVTTSGTLAVTATGSATEYIRGDGTLGTLPTSGGGGGSGVNYYLNGSVSQGTIGGSTYYEMSKTPIVGTGTNFTAAADGLIQQFITDAGDPNRLLIPAGAWNFELYFSASSAGGTPTFYVELLKYDGTTFTSIASSSTNPIPISNGTVTSLYVASLAVTETVLTATDRLAIRVYTNVSGRTITLHTEDNNLAQVITTFAGGIVSLNGLTANDQFFATGTTGTNFNITSTSATHTFNLPTASATNRGALSSTDWTTFNNKVNISDTAAMLTPYIRHAGYGLTKTGQALSVDTSAIATRSRVQKGIDSLGLVKQNVITNPITGTGTTNYVSKWTGTSTQAISQIFDNGTSVGINTATPSSTLGKLHIRGGNDNTLFVDNDGSSYTSLNFGFNGVQKGQLTRDNRVGLERMYLLSLEGNVELFSGGFYRVFTGGVNTGNERYRVTSAGDFGINTISPQYKLDVAGTLRNTTGAAFATSSGNVLVGTTTDGGLYKLDVQGALRNTTGANFATSSGNVGIGTASPTNYTNFSTLDLRGRNSSSGGVYQTGTSDGSVLGFLLTGSGGMSLNTVTKHPINFETNNVNRGIIDTIGRWGIGTTTPLSRLQVNGNIGITAVNTSVWGSPYNVIQGHGNAAIGFNSTNSLDLFQNAYFDGTNFRYLSTNLASGYFSGLGRHTFAVAASGTSGNVITFTDMMRINVDGVGIGNIAPSEKLHVTGRIRATTIDSTATGMNMLYADATGVIKKAAVPSGGGGSVTSITAGTGLTGGTITTSGTIAVDTASIATRARVQKGIDSVTTLANTKLSGTGISGYFPKWTGASTQDTSQLFQLGRNIGIGTATPTYRIHLPDAGNTANQAMIAGSVFGSDGNGQTIAPSSGAMAYYGQGSDGYIYGAQSSGGKWGVNTRSVSDAVFNVNGDVKIVTIDSTSTARNMLYQDANGVIKKSAVPTGNSGVINTSIAVASANYTVTSTDHFVYLSNLNTAGRNIVLPNDAVAGRQLIIYNTNNDATFKWTFTNEDVQDITGAAVTTLTNRKSYMLVFYEGVFHIISEN